MGLDLYHVVPLKKTEHTVDFFLLDDFEENPEFLQKYSHLIEEVLEYDFTFEILIFPDITTKELIFNARKDYIDKPYLVGDIQTLSEKIDQISAGKDIDLDKTFILEQTDNLLSNQLNRAVSYTSIIFGNDTPIKKQVLYWEKKGYQRKGMNEKFYQEFINSRNYYDKETVQKAYSYLEPSQGNSKEELEHAFKAFFIDNFVEGQSIFFASW